jgi:hypothetical protein
MAWQRNDSTSVVFEMWELRLTSWLDWERVAADRKKSWRPVSNSLL